MMREGKKINEIKLKLKHERFVVPQLGLKIRDCIFRRTKITPSIVSVKVFRTITHNTHIIVCDVLYTHGMSILRVV